MSINTSAVESQNVLFFTVHKAASMFIYKICHDLAKEAGLKYYSINHNKRNRLYFDTEESDLSELATWGERRGCFAPLRFFFAIPEELAAKVILHLRDPRDVLVSLYYSEAYSHNVIKGVFELGESERNEIKTMGIDRYVLEMAAEFNDKYSAYRQFLSQPGTTFVKYEDLILDFPKWLAEVVSGFGLKSEDFSQKLLKKYKKEFNVKKENVYSHKRKIIPGDYQEKLQPETIIRLNEIFAENLKVYRYAADSGY